MAKIRYGIVGLGGMGSGHARTMAGVEECVLTAVCDIDPVAAERAGDQFDVPHCTDYRELIERDDVDALIVATPHYFHPEIVIYALEHGKPVISEKPIAVTVAAADAMVAATRRAGVQLMVNWPFAWWAPFQHALNLAQGGRIGRLFGTRYRAAHCGPKELGCTPFFYEWLYDADRNGAGALMDYCSYGSALARYLLGQPSRVTGTVGRLVKDYVTVDDNAIITMQWPRAMALAEASWSQIGHLTSYVTAIYGTEGTLLVEPGKQGRLLLADREHDMGVELDAPRLPADRCSASAYFLSCIDEEHPVEGICSAEVGRDAQEILEAGLLSAATGSAISLPLPLE